jgi:hypothetical protein
MLSLAVWFPPRAALSAEPSGTERAQQLFDEGRELMKQQRFPEACAKLAESQELDPGGGTLLNLGICRKSEGRTATAYQLLTEALAQAQAAGRNDRVATAKRHLAELAPLLSRLVIDLPPGGLHQDTVVELDGSALSQADIARPLELDPGEHELRASEPGFESFSAKIVLGGNADVQRVAIPALTPIGPAPEPEIVMPPMPPEPAATPRKAEPAPVANDRDTSAHHSTLAYALIAGGGASLAVGAYLGGLALSQQSTSNEHWNGTHCTSQSCVDSWNDAKKSALACDVALAVGAAAAGTGLYLLLAKPGAPAQRATSVGVFVTGNASALVSATGKF